MALESLIYGLIAGVVILLIAWRLGARPRAWREAIATTILYVALWLALKAGDFSADLPLRGRLTARAEIHVVETVSGLDDRRSAARARLGFVAAHLHVVADLRSQLGWQMLFDLKHAARDHVLHRAVEARHLVC